MIRIVGYAALVVALPVALWGVVTAVLGVRRRRPDLIRSAESAAFVNFWLLTASNLAMVYGLLARDFSISYVARVGSWSTPNFIAAISLWSALEGSILFWGWVLATYTALAVWLYRGRFGDLMPYATATMLGVGAFFYLLLVGPANPFGLVSPAPPDGPGPNPLLQNHILMAVHPPLLYLGYVGMTVPFAFAAGALLSGRLDAEWIRATRRWTVVAWTFLTLAIVAGMWWSYEVLGWGGYWAWDPVENASLMPWLTATAYLHSTMVQERRNMLRTWNLTLIMSTFVLTILGTFLTRSGVITSVHAFTEGTIGIYFLVFIAAVLLFSGVLLAGRADELKSVGTLDSPLSRETVFLFNNLLFSAFTFTVLLGTLFPLVAEALRGVRVSVGAPFFNRMTLPIALALLLLMAYGPLLPWRKGRREDILRRSIVPTVALVVVGAASLLFLTRNLTAVLVFGLCAAVLAATAYEFVVGTRARMRAKGEGALVAFGRLVTGNRRRYGGYLAHVGIALMAVGIAASSTFKVEAEGTVRPGEGVAIGEYMVVLREVWAAEESHRFVVGADLSVERAGREVGKLAPRLNFYRNQSEPITTPAVRSRLDGDLYVNLMAFERDGSSATLRVLLEPLVPWIWIGGFVVAFGSFWAVLPPRRRRLRFDEAGGLLLDESEDDVGPAVRAPAAAAGRGA